MKYNLTQDNKEKFLEICHAIFKGDTFIFNLENGMVTWTSDGETVNIHWVEFVINGLIEKLYHVNKMWLVTVGTDTPTKLSLYENTFDLRFKMHKNHPIDYLYWAFTELKNTNK